MPNRRAPQSLFLTQYLKKSFGLFLKILKPNFGSVFEQNGVYFTLFKIIYRAHMLTQNTRCVILVKIGLLV